MPKGENQTGKARGAYADDETKWPISPAEHRRFRAAGAKAAQRALAEGKAMSEVRHKVWARWYGSAVAAFGHYGARIDAVTDAGDKAPQRMYADIRSARRWARELAADLGIKAEEVDWSPHVGG